MSDDVTIVQRTPPMVARAAPLPRPEPREQVAVTLCGGPLHGQVIDVWVDAKTIELPYSSGGDVAKPEIEASEKFDKDGNKIVIIDTKKTTAIIPAVMCVYKRRRANAKKAYFTDFA